MEPVFWALVMPTVAVIYLLHQRWRTKQFDLGAEHDAARRSEDNTTEL